MLQKVFPFLYWLPLAKTTLKDDIIAGVTGTVIVIPQAVAFAMIAGLPPVYGFYTAMITPIIAALFGSSYHLVTGPTTTSSIVLYAIVSKFVSPSSDLEAYITLAILVSFMAGIIKLFIGVFKMGKLANFVSNSVIIGFSAGAGILIGFKQLRHIFGINIPQGSSFSSIIKYIGDHIDESNWYAFLVALVTLLTAIVIKRIKKVSRLYMLVAMIVGSTLAYYINGYGHIELVGDIPSHLPPFNIPDFNIGDMRLMGSGALVLALLGLVEAAAISRTIALKSHQRLNVNQEFVSQGISNVVSSFFSCYTSSGSFTRSAVNYQVGAKTPMSSIFSAIFLMAVLLLFADYASFLPKAAMGGIILLVGYNLIDFNHIKQVYKASGRELIVFTITLLGTLFFDLEFALLAGILTSFFFYMERTSKPNIAVLGLDNKGKLINIIRDDEAKECSNLKIVRIDGSLYFGSIEKISKYLNKLYEDKEYDFILIAADGINFIDLAAAEWLTTEIRKWQKNRGGIYFAGLKLISQDVLIKGGFVDKIGTDIFFKEKKDAIKKIHEKIYTPCKEIVFDECFTHL